jgi:hypothetical protein
MREKILISFDHGKAGAHSRPHIAGEYCPWLSPIRSQSRDRVSNALPALRTCVSRICASDGSGKLFPATLSDDRQGGIFYRPPVDFRRLAMLRLARPNSPASAGEYWHGPIDGGSNDTQHFACRFLADRQVVSEGCHPMGEELENRRDVSFHYWRMNYLMKHVELPSYLSEQKKREGDFLRVWWILARFEIKGFFSLSSHQARSRNGFSSGVCDQTSTESHSIFAS